MYREYYYLEHLNKKLNIYQKFRIKYLQPFVSLNHHLVVMLVQLSMFFKRYLYDTMFYINFILEHEQFYPLMANILYLTVIKYGSVMEEWQK